MIVGGGGGDFGRPVAPATAGGRVFCAVKGGIAAFATASGERLWTSEAADSVYPAPVIDGAILVYARKATLVAADGGTGATTWSATLDGQVLGLQRIGTLIVATTELGTITAHDAESGTVRWRVAGDTGASAGAWGGRVAWWNRGRTHVLDASNGAEVVAFDGVLIEGGGLGLRGDGEALVACDPATGAERWRVGLGSRPHLPAAFAAAQLIVVCQDGTVRAIAIPKRDD